MRRICMFALLSTVSTGALSVAAFADPLQVIFSPYVMSAPVQQPVYVQPYAGQQYSVYAAPQQGYAAPPQSYAAPPRGYVTAQPQSYPSNYGRSYQQAAPSYTGAVAQRYATAAPAPSYAPPALMNYARARACARDLFGRAAAAGAAGRAASRLSRTDFRRADHTGACLCTGDARISAGAGPASTRRQSAAGLRAVEPRRHVGLSDRPEIRPPGRRLSLRRTCRAPSSSIRRTNFSIWSREAARPCATASASAGRASPGRA